MHIKEESNVRAINTEYYRSFIMKLIAYCCTSPNYALVMEFMPEGNLTNLLLSGTDLRWDARLTMAVEIAEGISYLHAHNPLV